MSDWTEGIWDASHEPVVPVNSMPQFVFLCMLRASDKYPSGMVPPYLTPFDSSGLTMFLRTHMLYHLKLAERDNQPIAAIRWFWRKIPTPRVLPT